MSDTKTKPVLDQGFEACAKGLTDFGYDGITPERVKEAHGRWVRGDEPKDVIDRFAFGNFESYPAVFGLLPE